MRSFAVTLPLLVAAHLAAQQPLRIIEVSPGVPVEVQELMAGAEGAAGAQAPGDPAASAAASARLQAVLAVKFDRRPSVVFAEWAKPELKPYDPSEEKKDKKEGEAGEPPAAPAVAEAAVKEPEIPPGTSEEDAKKIREAAAAAREKAEKAAEQAAEKALEQKRLQREVEMLQRDVTLGRWDRVGGFLQTIEKPDDRKKAYEHLLRGLAAPPQQPKPGVPPQLLEKNSFRFEDVLAVAGLAPGGFDEKQVPMLVPIVKLALDNGNVLESLLGMLRAEVERPDGERRLDSRRTALLLAAIGEEDELGPFLPGVEEAAAANDREGLNLRARHCIALYEKDQRIEHLELAWEATQDALAAGEIDEKEKADALRRALELAPRLREDLGPTWLVDSFSRRPERGMEIVATIGQQAALGFEQKPRDAAYRQTGLALQKAAVEALFASAPQLAEEWRRTLGLLAGNWILEASWSNENSQTTSLRPVLQRDDFGNLFYAPRQRGGEAVQSIEPDELLDVRPSGQWEELLDDSLRPHLATVTAQLFLKVGEDAQAFPYIEELAQLNPRVAKDLANEFLQVWMRNHDPNRNRNTNAYMFMYGFDRRASGIPLTRSKQQRNLEELSGWVRRLRALPIDGVDEELLGQAFRTAHSTAEVYRLETIESVFGDLGELDPLMLAELLGTMRTNLATIWRLPSVQEDSKTKRSQRDIEREVLRGYATALEVAQTALSQHGEHWALRAAMASILHDANNFKKELHNDAGFSEARQAAFALFSLAADDYVDGVGDLRLDQETTRVFDSWFFGALGACDLGAIDESTVLAESQLPRLKAALESLPDGARERHIERFASQIFTRMAAVNPQIKARYLEAAFAVVGDHPQAYEAKKVFDYYKDLTAEIQLVASVDGSTDVGTEPFGVGVDIEHTVEIERESGGFGKYLQNQNNMAYAYNYGRPTENYRDKFHEAVAQAMGDNFEVLSVTFNADTATSISLDRPGWRKTPYAYVLLRASGPQVDRVPTMKLDLDFLDTSGYVVLPVGSAPLPIDASRSDGSPRPYSELEVTQLLDERHADKGKLVVELKASARGLVPDLDHVVDATFPGFDVTSVDDQGVSVSKFTEDQEGVRSDRLWLITLKATPGAADPDRFRFASLVDPDAKAVFQRYDDADLATVDAEVELLADYGHGANWWPWIAGGLALLALSTWLFFRGRGPSGTEVGAALQMPRHVTPFTVLTLLRQILASGRLAPAEHEQLRVAIEAIEQHHFARGEGPGPDLRVLAEEWLRRAG